MSEVKPPDFEEMLDLVSKIRENTYEKIYLDSKLKFLESEIMRQAFTDEKYFQNGKPPSVAYIKSLYETGGFGGELMPLRDRYAVIVADLEMYKLKLDVLKMQFDYYKVENYLSRNTSL